MIPSSLSWLKRTARATSSQPCPTAPRPIFRPNLDTLEDRTVLSITPMVNLPLDVGPVKVVTEGAQQTLQAAVNIAGQLAGTLVMDAATSPAAPGAVPILNLHINEIHLNLLGLHVDTSDICLDVTAQPGGGLLGDLLGGLAGGLDLGGILDQLSGVTADLNTFLDGLGNLLDGGGNLPNQIGVLDQAMTVTNVLGTDVGSSSVTTPHADDGFCDILNLSLGPINLNLLGLNVALDNCADPAGPITVDVTADPNGGLLGGLLCGLADGNLLGLNINRLLGRLDNLIDRLGNLADRLDDIADLPDRFERIADRLVDQLERVANRVDSLADLDRLINRIDRVVRRLDRLIDNSDAPVQVTNRLERLVTQLTRIVNRFRDLGFVDRVSAPLERVIDQLMARL